MYNLVFPYLLGTAFSIAVVAMALIAFLRYRSRAASYERLERNLPDACRYLDLQQRLGDMEEEFRRVQESLYEARHTIAERDDAERWLKEHKDELLSVEAERSQQEHVRAELMKIQDELGQEKDRLLQLAKELQGMEFQREALQQKSDQLQASIEDAEGQHKQLSTSLESLKESEAALKTECAAMTSQLSSYQEQIAEAKAELERRLRAIEQEVKEATDARERSLAALDRERQEIREARDALRESLNKDRSEMETTQEKLGSLKQQLASSTAELAGLKSACQQESTALLKIQKETDQDNLADERRTSELWEPVFNKANHPELNKIDEQQQLDKVSAYMESRGLVFPDRVLKAFHTSLKVSEISPLVVLAGISGTGKSELPLRYAEAMNMHFLNMAVQPRWDSPQDMFGFFNYLEGRFRSTPLGRALIQMDPYHDVAERGWKTPDDWSKNHSLSNQMLIVLLDEMNLARIEYYFSEFLSRLETRRGIDRDNPEERRKAEIGLDIGSSSGGTATMQLFVDTNVLFVGTMNEDETTQTLSDKVVDRANVLRFGRPHNLRLNASSNGQPVNVSDDRLAHETWQSWRKHDLPDNVASRVEDWISQLNDAMDSIRRPFAHRTTLAIQRYVANYPGLEEDDETALYHAMSDQLEQKIFPKFRGLDPTEPHVRRALDTLRLILMELHDEQLAETIDDCRKEHQFVWMGVDRFEQEVEA